MYKASAWIPGRSGFLRSAGAVVVCSLLVPTAAIRAQTGAAAHPQVRSVVFQDQNADSRIDDGNARANTAVAPRIQVGLAGSLVFQDPKGNFRFDHGNARALGFSLQMPIRRSKEWSFLPTITTISSSPGPSKAKGGTVFGSSFSELDHETKSFGLDVHWRGRNPGAGYLLFGSGLAKVKLDVTRSQCAVFVFSCNDTATTVGSKTAPFLQVGFGFEGERKPSVNGGPFIEARLWRGPYLQPIALANGTVVESRAKTGHALLVALGMRWYSGPF